MRRNHSTMFHPPLTQMTAAELFEAARRKEAEEQQRAQTRVLDSLRQLRESRKSLQEEQRTERAELLKRQRKELRDLERNQQDDLADIDKRIADLEIVLQIRMQKTVPQVVETTEAPAPKTAQGESGEALKAMDILHLMKPGKNYRSDDLKTLITATGATPPRHFAQTLSYLRKNGHLQSPSRGVYLRPNPAMASAA